MPSLTTLKQTLAHFASSPLRFEIVRTLPPSLVRLPTKRLYILDSSFNPPTWAHMRMCLSALLPSTPQMRDDDDAPEPKRLLLLLATKNADKAAAPAAFEQRLAMMGAFAEDLEARLKVEREKSQRRGGSAVHRGQREAGGEDDENAVRIHSLGRIASAKSKGGEGTAKSTIAKEQEDEDVIIDIGVTKEAMFVEKAKAIEESGLYVYPLGEKGEVEQVHLTGYDTLVRLVDPKYYPPRHTLAPLEPLFAKHSVRVTMRTPPSVEEQMRFVDELRHGARESQGWKREWAESIELVDGKGEGEESISSTKARESYQDSELRHSQGGKWCSESVVAHVLEEELYSDSR